MHAAEQDRPDVAAARRAWRAQQPALSPKRLVFIDETWATTALARRYGRARRGQRLVAGVPHGHWKTTTFVAALRHDGLSAPCVFDRAITGARVLYLPPYSPDLNPIEHAFAKLKALLHTAAARTVEGFWHTIGQLLDAFSPAECAHYLAHAGYVPSNRQML